MGFWGGLFGGSNSVENGNIDQAGQISGFSTGVGEGAVSNANNFYSTLLSGDPRAEAKLLAPQIDTMQKQGQQQLATTSEFGNRSGGTNASGQTNMDNSRANIDNMISQLTGGAASGEAALGENQMGLGLQSNELQDKEAQQRMQNQKNSILGQGLTKGSELAEDFATGGSGGVQDFFSGGGF
jgi:hypothetical protein